MSTKYDRKELVRAFYEAHPDNMERASVWFEKWEAVYNKVIKWDDETTDNEYGELCDWFGGEKYLEHWYRHAYGGRGLDHDDR